MRTAQSRSSRHRAARTLPPAVAATPSPDLCCSLSSPSEARKLPPPRMSLRWSSWRRGLVPRPCLPAERPRIGEVVGRLGRGPNREDVRLAASRVRRDRRQHPGTSRHPGYHKRVPGGLPGLVASGRCAVNASLPRLPRPKWDGRSGDRTFRPPGDHHRTTSRSVPTPEQPSLLSGRSARPARWQAP